MIINTSNINMNSKRTYYSKTTTSGKYLGIGRRGNVSGLSVGNMALLGGLNSQGNTLLEDTVRYIRDDYEELRRNRRMNGAQFGINNQNNIMLENVEFQSFVTSLNMFSGSLKKMKMVRITSLMEQLYEAEKKNKKKHVQQDSESVSNDIAGKSDEASLSPSQSWGALYEESQQFEEREKTSFTSNGTVTTADGRSISFHITAMMSRSFQEYTKSTSFISAAELMDPLVINLDTDSAQVKDQTFLFDIDADGTLDTISMLSEACGFLALDRNGDGVINDGSELFGTKTGNGFAELAVFDMDGNGWIDENDEIFDQLRIWTKDAQGNDKLVGIGVAGIGAIYLGNVNSDFNLNDKNTNEINAQVRKTGIYLKESGEVGTIQQVDMAKKIP